MDKIELNRVEEAIADIKAGKVIIIVDDEDRENEGDFVTAACNATPEVINFMATHGRGLICAPLTEERAHELKLDMMVPANTSLHETPFTVSVDLLGHGCTTGISASDRSKTVKALIDKNINASEFGRPGHIFPLKSKPGGVLRRAGHTEATVDIAVLAGFDPCGVLVEILNEDGTMARLPELVQIAKRFDLKIISIKDLISYRLAKEKLVSKEVEVEMPTTLGDFKLIVYKVEMNGQEHMALIKGSWKEDEPVLVRMHSSCVTGDIFGSCRCDCGPQLHESMRMIEKEGKGVIVYLNQEGRGIGLLNKLKAYKLQEQGMDTVEANIELGFKPDERDYGVGAQILRDMGVRKIKLITNNPRKRAGLVGYGIEIMENVPLIIQSNPHNEKYLATKKLKLGHHF
ncbi:MAG TPA: bifunctional 3,4-dihydroxy-2-butanone-4-phosphate synthase/GTP cyclohydrolase II [Bacteroidia bacterium]|nr:bifunctional 3,4-dihydroxy-2-butanone-4-phosphate synthase/GTP cyclohydrolase II [Bacteroidia bacterium]